jgi:signal transduction histidine kinase
MGRELHDGLCQDLAGIAALCGSLARRLTPAAESESESAAVREIGKLIGESIQHARELARASDPLNLETIGLQMALENFCSRTGSQFEIACNLDCVPSHQRLGKECEMHLYRIVQEAVNNATTHGRAKTISVNLAYSNVKGVLSIEDDGIGIDDLHRARKGMGLRSMAYRASLIGASIELDRRATCGTKVTCVFSTLSATPES